MTTHFFSLLSFIAVFGSGIRDPGWVKIRIRDKNPGSATLKYTVRKNSKPPAVPVSLLEEVLVLDERDAIRLEVGLLQATRLAVLRSIATVPIGKIHTGLQGMYRTVYKSPISQDVHSCQIPHNFETHRKGLLLFFLAKSGKIGLKIC
jgi:hypothetical protein